jgi:hypothetical protein
MSRSAVVPPSAVLLAVLAGAAGAQSPGEKLVYSALSPCRIADSRLSSEGALAPGAARNFHVVGTASDFTAQGGNAGGCGVPGFALGQPQVRAVVLNLVAVNPQGAGNLRAWAADQAAPNASVLNYAQVAGLNIANGVVVKLRQDSEGQDLSLRADVSATQVVIDVVGYFHALALSPADLPVVPVNRGGTGSTVQNFVDLSTNQAVGGEKTFSANTSVTADLAATGVVSAGQGYQQPGAGAERLKTIRGGVSSLGDIFVGAGFTSAQVGPGRYQVTFNTQFADYPSVQATPFGLPGVARLVGIGQSFVIVEITDFAGVPFNASFLFTATGRP